MGIGDLSVSSDFSIEEGQNQVDKEGGLGKEAGQEQEGAF